MSLENAVIAFDLDGTLVDTAPDLIGALNAVLAEQGLPPVPLASARHLVGHGVRALLERGFAEAGRTLSTDSSTPLLDRFIEVYFDRIAEESRPFEGVEAALDELSGAGARLVVCTNKRTDLSIALLDALALTSRFEAVIGSDLGKQKPDPSLLYLAIQRAGGVPARALFVGDSQVDLQTARAAGVPIVGVSFGMSDPPLVAEDVDGFIHSYAELPAAARRLLGEA